jgi:putative toxin-antitoxin system antitoxin component (TIGR02293 family)
MKNTLVSNPAGEREVVFNFLDIKKVPEGLSTKQVYLAIVKSGIHARSVSRFSLVSHLSKKLISRLIHINERTLQRYSPAKKLDLNSSERLLELARLYYFGIEIFGDSEKFNQWLNRESMAMGKAKPIDLLETHVGYKMVMDELMRIEYGVFS